MKRATSVDDHKLILAYESLRKLLAAPKYAERINKPLAFWALPADRRLPMALLGYSINELLSRTLQELSATPGIGKRKLSSLIRLLHRVGKDDATAAPLFPMEATGLPKGTKSKSGRHAPASRAGFDPEAVSELLWEQWRRTIRRYGLEQDPLGRLAPSLKRLPTVIWRTPLETYLDSTIADIRGLKTYGEKRLHAILEVFHSIHETVGNVPLNGHLHLEVRPNFTAPIEQWVEEALHRPLPPAPAELKQRVILPILQQLRIDAGEEIFRILEERLGVKGSPVPVQQQARRLGVTRARVYQLLEMCADILEVRWPEGEMLFRRLHEKLASFPNAKQQVARLRALTDIIYPELRNLLAESSGQRTENGAMPRLAVAR